MARCYMTKHAKERFSERFPAFVKAGNVEAGIQEVLGAAAENRSIYNNSALMNRVYERYGFDQKYVFLVFKDILFLCIDKGSLTPVCVTVIDLSDTSKYGMLRHAASSFRRSNHTRRITEGKTT